MWNLSTQTEIVFYFKTHSDKTLKNVFLQCMDEIIKQSLIVKYLYYKTNKNIFFFLPRQQFKFLFSLP